MRLNYLIRAVCFCVGWAAGGCFFGSSLDAILSACFAVLSFALLCAVQHNFIED